MQKYDTYRSTSQLDSVSQTLVKHVSTFVDLPENCDFQIAVMMLQKQLLAQYIKPKFYMALAAQIQDYIAVRGLPEEFDNSETYI